MANQQLKIVARILAKEEKKGIGKGSNSKISRAHKSRGRMRQL